MYYTHEMQTECGQKKNPNFKTSKRNDASFLQRHQTLLVFYYNCSIKLSRESCI